MPYTPAHTAAGGEHGTNIMLSARDDELDELFAFSRENAEEALA